MSFQRQTKDLYASASIANGATATLWSYTIPPRMTGLTQLIANGCDTAAAVNGTSFWSLRKNGIGISPYDLIYDILASTYLPRKAETLYLMGGDVISAFASNGYSSSAKWSFLLILDIYGEAS
jgi:hypothetical protein